MHSSRVHTHFSKHHFYLFSPSLVHYEYERARDGAASICQALLLKAAPQGLLGTQASSAAASDKWDLKVDLKGCKQHTNTSVNSGGPGRFFSSKYSSRLKVMTDYSMIIRGCEKRQSLLFHSISISNYFISVYLEEKGLQYLPTYKPTLYPEENRIMIILKTTSKSYLTFKVNYCIIRRQCSKVSNSVILQTTAKLKTFIKANTAITVHTTFLGWLKDLALCLLCCIQFLGSSRVGVQQHSAQAYVCSHCTAWAHAAFSQRSFSKFCSSCKTPQVYIYPQEEKSTLTLGCYQLQQKTIPPLSYFAQVSFLSASEVLQWCLIIKLGIKVVEVQFISTCSAFLYE